MDKPSNHQYVQTFEHISFILIIQNHLWELNFIYNSSIREKEARLEYGMKWNSAYFGYNKPY